MASLFLLSSSSENISFWIFSSSFFIFSRRFLQAAQCSRCSFTWVLYGSFNSPSIYADRICRSIHIFILRGKNLFKLFPCSMDSNLYVCFRNTQDLSYSFIVKSRILFKLYYAPQVLWKGIDCISSSLSILFFHY